jgi:integrase
VTFLTATEIDALLAAPDQDRWEGRRDRALLLLAIQAGLRVSELTSLNCSDVTLGTGASVRCEGKGRKQRAVPLTSPSETLLRTWLRERAGNPAVRCSRPAPDGGLAATPSRCGSAPTPRLQHSDARPCSARRFIRTSCATAAPCHWCKPASTPQ